MREERRPLVPEPDPEWLERRLDMQDVLGTTLYDRTCHNWIVSLPLKKYTTTCPWPPFADEGDRGVVLLPLDSPEWEECERAAGYHRWRLAG
jgi:hypothetical protein